MMKNYSIAAERNKEPILQQLNQLITTPALLLEIGSGSGQHALHFSRQLPHIQWQPTEQAVSLPALKENLQQQTSDNLLPAKMLDVNLKSDFTEKFDLLFTANTLHIMSLAEVKKLFIQADTLLQNSALMLIYGPFRYNEHFTSESNARFDQWLKARDPESGIRDFELIEKLTAKIGFNLAKDIQMPANNQLLIWSRHK